MIKFTKFVILIFSLAWVLLFLLEKIYDSIYLNSYPRNSTNFIIKNQKKDFDYVFIGSSRVQNSIDVNLVDKMTKKKSINLGVQGAKLDDYAIYLKLLIHHHYNIEKLFIQVDYIFNHDSNSNTIRSEMMPFLNNHSTVHQYIKKRDSTYFFLKNVPFYKYMVNDYRIGFRECFSNFVNKKIKRDLTNGYVPLYGVMGRELSFGLPSNIINKNKAFDEIEFLCKKHQIEVIYFTAPFCQSCKNVEYIDKLKARVPSLKDYSRIIRNDSLFQNCGHLNHKGARYFTAYLVNDLKL